jgi:hypothetical protein
MKILVHHCIAQEVIAYGLMEPSVENKCRCRKKISLKRATQLVHEGAASWITATRVRGEREKTCRLCEGNKEIKSCALCLGKGFTIEPFVEDTPGSDILLISRNPKDTKDKKSYWLKQKTPRTATIEQGHMERALDFKEAKERVEDYGWMIQMALYELGAEIRYRVETGKALETLKGYEGRPEPENNEKTRIGRDYDWGRAI